MMECNFIVGQKVVLIDNNWLNRSYSSKIEYPVKGVIYTIRKVKLSMNTERGGVRPGILLEEIVNGDFLLKTPNGVFMCEPKFDFARFRAVPQRNTDISVFKAMLKRSKQVIPA